MRKGSRIGSPSPCLAEGLNIPEASVVVFLDYDWVPSVMAQAFSRVLRPQQERDVRVHFLTCRGTIEEYMELPCDCKRRAIAEGLDYEEYDFRLEDLPAHQGLRGGAGHQPGRVGEVHPPALR